MEDLFKIDEEAFKDAFKIDTSRMNMDTSAFSDMDFSGVDMSDLIDADALSGAMPVILNKRYTGYLKWCIRESDKGYHD